MVDNENFLVGVGSRLIDIATSFCFCQETFSFLSADLNIRPMGSIGQPRLCDLQRRLLGFKGSPAQGETTPLEL